jgi:hypothetical protein
MATINQISSGIGGFWDEAVVPVHISKCRLLSEADIRSFGLPGSFNQQGWPVLITDDARYDSLEAL